MMKPSNEELLGAARAEAGVAGATGAVADSVKVALEGVGFFCMAGARVCVCSCLSRGTCADAMRKSLAVELAKISEEIAEA